MEHDALNNALNDALNDALKDTLLHFKPEPGLNQETDIENFFLIHKKRTNKLDHCVSQPFCCYIMQGSKQTVLGDTTYQYSAGQALVSGVDMPSASCVLNPNVQEDFLAVFFYLNRETLMDLSLKMKHDEDTASSCSPIFSFQADDDFRQALKRLMDLMYKPEQIPVMAPIIMRELHYLLLLLPNGHSLRSLALNGSPNSRIARAITLMKDNISSALHVSELAKQVNMSVSTLHRHFKNVTGISPLQYHKKLRLYEAQRLMLVDKEGVASAAMTVGYESPNQFSREYKRLFGESPHRDIQNKMMQNGWGAQ